MNSRIDTTMHCAFCGTKLQKVPKTLFALRHNTNSSKSWLCPMGEMVLSPSRWERLRLGVEKLRSEQLIRSASEDHTIEALLVAACRMLRRDTWSKRAEDRLVATAAYAITGGRVGQMYEGTVDAAERQLAKLHAKVRRGDEPRRKGGAR